jgi:hypothetical protein
MFSPDLFPQMLQKFLAVKLVNCFALLDNIPQSNNIVKLLLLFYLTCLSFFLRLLN